MNGRFVDGDRGELARTLFESAEADSPPPGAHERALFALGLGTGAAASSAAASAGVQKATTAAVTGAAIVKWVAMGAGIAFLTVGTLAVMGQGLFEGEETTTEVVTTAARRAGAREALTRSPAPPPAEGQAAPPAAPPERPVASGAVIPFESLPRAEPAPQKRPEARAHSHLAQEVESLDRVRLALASSNPAGALRELDAFGARFPGAALGPESTVLRVQALLQAGNRAAAERLARRFVAASPGSPHATRIRILLGGLGSDRSGAGAAD